MQTPLTVQQKQDRLDLAREHRRWTGQQWRTVLFTDESKFCADFLDRRRRVWRRPGERYLPVNVVEHDRFGGQSVMVWAGISVDGRTDLYVIRNGALTGLRYRDEILDPIVRPFAGAVGLDFTLMDDNARPHRARVVTEYLEQEGITRMDWPARSPDLNPIEHVWDMLQVRVRARQNPPTTARELETALMEEWNLVPQQQISRLILSMRRRCMSVIDANGGHTHY